MQKLKSLADQGWFNKEELQTERQAILDKAAPAKWMAWEKTPRKTADIAGNNGGMVRNQVGRGGTGVRGRMVRTSYQINKAR